MNENKQTVDQFIKKKNGLLARARAFFLGSGEDASPKAENGSETDPEADTDPLPEDDPEGGEEDEMKKENLQQKQRIQALEKENKELKQQVEMQNRTLEEFGQELEALGMQPAVPVKKIHKKEDGAGGHKKSAKIHPFTQKAIEEMEKRKRITSQD